MTLTKKELDELELELAQLEHHPHCPVYREHSLCECGLSEGRRRIYNYIQSMRNLTDYKNAKTN